MKKTIENKILPIPVEQPAVALSSLREIQVRCEAVASCRLLGLANDMKLQAIGRSAKRAMPDEVSDALYALEAREKTIVSEIVADLQKQDLSEEVMNREYAKAVGRNAEIREIQQTAAELWKTKVPYQVQPLTLAAGALPVDEAGKLDMPEVANVTYRGNTLGVDPYTAFLDLTADAIIVLEE